MSPSGPALEAARRVAPLAHAESEEIERDRSLPSGLLGELIDGGLMNMCLPSSLGGIRR